MLIAIHRPSRRRICCATGIMLLACCASSVVAAEVSFLQDVAPILLQRCAGCHGPTKVEGDFRLHTFEYLLKPGASEDPTIVAGRPDVSAIVARITEADESTRMPQLDDPLSDTEISLIRRWISEGARFDGRDPKAPIKSQMPPRAHPDPPGVYRIPVPIFAMAFSPDGRELAVGGHNEVTIWNPGSGVLLRRLTQLPQRIHAVTYSRDGRSLFVAGGIPGEYGELAEVDSATGQRRRVFGTFDDVVLGTALNRDETRIAATSADRSVRAYSLADGQLLWQSQLHFDWVTSVAFSHDDRFVATGSKDCTIKVLDANTGALFTTYNGHKRQLGKEAGRFEVYSLAFSESSSVAFSAGKGRSIRAWEPEKAQQENGSASDMELRFFKADHTQFLPHDAQHPVFKLVAHGNDLFAATGDGAIKQYEVASLKPVRDFTGHRDWVFAIDCHAASHRLASASHDGQVRIWDTTTGVLLKTFVAAPGFVSRD